jgi:hypothetical protein
VVAATWARAEKELHAALRELIRAAAAGGTSVAILPGVGKGCTC